MKKLFLAVVVSTVLLLTACTKSDTLKIGVDFYPMPQIAELIYDDLLNDGVKLETVSMNYNNLNAPLNNGEIDGNLIQHQYFMEFFNQANNADLVVAQPVYHSKFALFSDVYQNVEDILDGETVHLPSDVVNLPRALILLEANGLITLKEGVTKTAATLDDIQSNPKNLKFEVSTINVTPLAYRDGGRRLAVMYPSYILTALGEIEETEYLVQEELNDLTKTYAISFVVKASKLNDPAIQTFIKHLTSEKVRNWIIAEYGLAAIPAF